MKTCQVERFEEVTNLNLLPRQTGAINKTKQKEKGVFHPFSYTQFMKNP